MGSLCLQAVKWLYRAAAGQGDCSGIIWRRSACLRLVLSFLTVCGHEELDDGQFFGLLLFRAGSHSIPCFLFLSHVFSSYQCHLFFVVQTSVFSQFLCTFIIFCESEAELVKERKDTCGVRVIKEIVYQKHW